MRIHCCFAHEREQMRQIAERLRGSAGQASAALPWVRPVCE